MSAIDLLDDYRVGHLELTLKNGDKRPLDCVARVIHSPVFETTFLPDVLPLEDLDRSAKCIFRFDHNGEPYSLDARIDQIASPERLVLIALESFSHVQKRQFFRVETEAELLYCPLCEVEDENLMTFQGRRVKGRINLSGGGIRFPVDEPLAAGERVWLDITLEKRHVRCSGRVIRMLGGGDSPLEAALEFDGIEADVRDVIMGYCFAEQRRQLRLQVRLMDR